MLVAFHQVATTYTQCAITYLLVLRQRSKEEEHSVEEQQD